MSHAGRALERFVSLVEDCLGPEGARVTSPDHLEDRITGQPREVDVSIRMRVGSSDVLIVAECRDHQDAQDVTWIEQLAQKASDVRADRAIAVSSSGFSEAARRKANFLSIATRLVDELTYDDIKSWCGMKEMTVLGFHSELERVWITTSAKPEAGAAVSSLLANPNWKTAPMFLFNHQQTSLQGLWDAGRGHRDVISGIPHDGSRVKAMVEVNYPPPGRVLFVAPAGTFKVPSIKYSVVLWAERSTVPVAAIRQYGDEQGAVARAVLFPTVDFDGSKVAVSLVRNEREGTVRVAFEQGEGKSTSLSKPIR